MAIISNVCLSNTYMSLFVEEVLLKVKKHSLLPVILMIPVAMESTKSGFVYL